MKVVAGRAARAADGGYLVALFDVLAYFDVARSRRGNGHYDKTSVNHYFRDILFECGIMHGNKSDGGPHLHNLRHTFCVHSLEAMLRNVISHQAALPLLMTYMGHSSLSATGRYLKLTAEAFPDLVDQISRIYADIIPDLEVKTEYEDE